MEGETTNSAQEIRRLQRCMNDLVSVLALPAAWSGGESQQIVHTLLKALLRVLALDFVYARLKDPNGAVPVDTLHIATSGPLGRSPQTISAALEPWLQDDAQGQTAPARIRLDNEDISVFPVWLGPHGEIGLLLAGSGRDDFPLETERLVLNIAANQAVVSLQQARLLGEQKRVAGELDNWVARRTAELAAANEELRKEIAEHQQTEHKLRRNEEALRDAHALVARGEELWRSVFENSAIGVALTDLEGHFIATNPVYQKMLGYTEEELQKLGFDDVTHADNQAANAALIGELMGSSRRQFQMEEQYRRKDGSLVWVRNNVSLVPGTERLPQFLMELSEDIAERKYAEEALRASESNFRLIVDTIPGQVCTLKPNFEVELVNKPLRDYFGLALEQLKDWEFIGVVHPDDLERVIAQSRHSAATAEPYSIEHRCRRHDGVFRWFQVRALPLRGADGQVVRWYLLLIDIEDRKRAEEAVMASERNLKLIINTIPALAWSARPEGTAEFFNQRWLDYTGLTAEQASEWGWTVALHPDDLDRVTSYWQAAVATSDSVEIEARLRRSDGAYRWFLFRASALRDDAGAIVKWYGTNADIDDRKRAEEHVRRSEAFLVEGQRLSRTGTFSWRVETGEITWSDELYRIFELDPATPATLELIGRRVHPEDLPMIGDMLASAQRADSQFEYEPRIVMADGSIKHIHLIAHAVRDAEGRLENFGAAQDVTGRRLAEEGLTRARAELADIARVTSFGVLTASIAHEVNQPLSGIITNASTCLRMLDTDPPNLDGARETARRTIRDGHRASDVVMRLRGLFSKKEAAVEPVDLNEAAREVFALMLSELQQARVVLQSELSEDLPLIQGDRIQLQEVILNLLRNASDAMNTIEDRPRHVRIRTSRDASDDICLTVEDTGIGFDPQHTDALFQPFHTTKSDGMGIGLSVSRSIIEAHRGRLWATPNDGPGATFAFSIPRNPEAS